ncbi:MAG: hypothetical protein J0L76_08685 [Rhodobacterales bacterium]|nr:hypothetical protein [Rhodobacterales bacterium]
MLQRTDILETLRTYRLIMQFKCSSEDWSNVAEFWSSVVGLHDSLLADAQYSKASTTMILEFQEVLTHSPDSGFRIAHPRLQLQLTGAEDGNFQRVQNAVGHDVAATELLPRELWVNTMGGSFSVSFASLRFVIP